MAKHDVEEDDDTGMPDFEQINREMVSKDQENQYLRSRSLQMQDAIESNFNPKQDANVIEFKLSSEELLERIEHYLRGDILKTRINENKQAETFYTTPTKKLSVNLYRDNQTGRVYVVNEHPTGKKEEDWDVISVFDPDEGDAEKVIETPVEQNYKLFILNELQTILKSKAKKPRVISLGIASKEIQDNSRINLNEYGVVEVMNILSLYITKETFLSYYKEERIYEICGDLGNQLNKFFLINSKAMGLDTEYKKTKYPLIIVTILHSVESAYRRALLGNENKGTREGILVTQHQGVGNPQNYQPMPTSKKKSWSPFDKSSW
jgi:hypothetical protein